jgi:hypothetical protein
LLGVVKELDLVFWYRFWETGGFGHEPMARIGSCWEWLRRWSCVPAQVLGNKMFHFAGGSVSTNAKNSRVKLN